MPRCRGVAQAFGMGFASIISGGLHSLLIETGLLSAPLGYTAIFGLEALVILVAGGWRPGHSTDFNAVVLGKYLGAKRIINLSNIDAVYDRDPKQFPDAQPIRNIDWQGFRAIVGDVWDPGMNTPFDPIAAQLAGVRLRESFGMAPVVVQR